VHAASELVDEPRMGVIVFWSALRAAKGDVLAFTDDDCQLHPEYVNDLLRHAGADTDLILRGGRTELDDPTDLPLTINTSTIPKRWSRALDSVRAQRVQSNHAASNGRTVCESPGQSFRQTGQGGRGCM
jgi:glycosyltransferase involved in cell wall biosynthesis